MLWALGGCAVGRCLLLACLPGCAVGAGGQVTMLADGGAQFTKATGLDFQTGNFGGLRMQRMSMLVSGWLSHAIDMFILSPRGRRGRDC